MFFRSVVSSAALGGLVLMALASGGLPSADPAANKEACRAYWTAYNANECLPGGVEIDAEQACGNMDNPYVDMRPYYTCLEEKLVCTDGVMDTSGQSDCNDKLTP